MDAAKEQMHPDARSSRWSVSVQATRTRYFGLISVYLCASLLQKLAVLQDFYFLLSICVERSWRPCIPWCETGGFNAFVLAAAARSLSVFHCLPFFFCHGLALWDLSLRINTVSSTLSRLCIAELL